MAKINIWPVVHSERAALVADLTPLTQEQWSTSSLCSDWTVQDVVAHMSATAKITPASFFPKLAASGFSFGRMQAKDIEVENSGGTAGTLAGFESVVSSRKRPPGPPQAMLGETIIHAEDIRRALGITHDYPMESVTQVADFYKASNLIIGAKRRIAGVRLVATDTEWSHGSGPEVSGPIVAVLLAMTGRKAALGDLSGDGVSTLQQRP
jgi:uncharacterized protein (TIGR03083 family)